MTKCAYLLAISCPAMKKSVIFLINWGIEIVSLCQVWVLCAQHVYRRAHGKGFSILFTWIPEGDTQVHGGYFCLYIQQTLCLDIQ
jgi:hypothetical protein